MKNLKKIGALLLALVLVLSLGATAFADSDLAGDGVDGSKTATESSTKVTLYKELTVFNPTATAVNAPTISYTYEIAGAAGGSTITDADGISAVTYAGVGAPTITATVAWDPSESVNASATGAKNTKPIEVDFSGVTFTRAGVYRYKITETITDAAYTAAGVVNGEISNERWLDVYVKDTNIIYGYVLMDASGNVTSATAKTEGFVATTGEGAKTADQYHTFNLTISKTVENDTYIASTHHEFPFTVTFTNTTVTGAVKPIVSTNGTATLAQADAAAIASFAATAPTIADSGSVTYTGIPMLTEVSIVEQNDVAGTTYAVTSAGADTNITTAELVASGSSTTTGTITVATQTAGTEADKTVAVTNTLALISPTGVVLRVAPYILMLAGGIVLLALSRKRKSREEA